MGLQTGKIESKSGDRKTWTRKWLKNQSNRKLRRFPHFPLKFRMRGYEL